MPACRNSPTIPLPVSQRARYRAPQSLAIGRVCRLKDEAGGSEVVLFQGDPLLWGASYWGPIDRNLTYIVPGWTRLPAEDDPRLLNVVIQDRVGPVGFSPIAEDDPLVPPRP